MFHERVDQGENNGHHRRRDGLVLDLSLEGLEEQGYEDQLEMMRVLGDDFYGGSWTLLVE